MSIPSHFRLTRTQAVAKGKRAGKATAARYAHVIEGELVTTTQVAKRIGTTYKVAYDRITQAARPLTWETLEKWQ